MITYTMGINLEYLRIVITIWREYGMLCPIIIPKDQDAEGAVMVKIGPTTDMKVAEMVDKIWDIAELIAYIRFFCANRCPDHKIKIIIE